MLDDPRTVSRVACTALISDASAAQNELFAGRAITNNAGARSRSAELKALVKSFVRERGGSGELEERRGVLEQIEVRDRDGDGGANQRQNVAAQPANTWFVSEQELRIAAYVI